MINPKEPPRLIPEHLVDSFTMGRRIPIRYQHFNGTRSGNTVVEYTTQMIDECLAGLAEKKTFYYGQTDIWLRQAIERFPIRGDKVAVMGSIAPVYESTVIHHGGKPTTIEYNPIICNDDRLTTLTVDQFNKNPLQFSAALSISSFEHDGLG